MARSSSWREAGGSPGRTRRPPPVRDVFRRRCQASLTANGPESGAHLDGYMKVLDVRTTAGRFGAAGPAAVWTRANVGLVAGEEPSPFERAAVVADSGSGVSRGVELGRWLAINRCIQTLVVAPLELR